LVFLYKENLPHNEAEGFAGKTVEDRFDMKFGEIGGGCGIRRSLSGKTSGIPKTHIVRSEVTIMTIAVWFGEANIRHDAQQEKSVGPTTDPSC